MFKTVKSVLRQNDFLYLFLAEIISVFGDVLFFTAIMWFVFSQSNSSTAVGLLKAVDLLPTLLFVFLFGVFIDRKRSVIIFRIIYIAQGAVVLVLIGAFFSGNVSIPLILTCIFVNALVASGKAPLLNKLLVKINRKNLPEMNTLLAFGKSCCTIGASLLAGLLAENIFLIIVVDLLTFVLAFLLISLIKVKVDREAVEKETLSLKGEIIETIMYLKGNKPLLKMIVVFVFIILTGVSCSLSFPVISEVLNIGNQGFGLLKSVYNGGGLLILFLMPLIKNCQNKIHRFIILSGVMMGGYGIVLNFPIKLVLLLFIGTFSAVTDILFTTFIQKTADEKILGKLFSLITVIAILSSMLGNILYGFLYDALSVQTVMLFSGAVFVLCGGLLWKITDSKVFDFETK